MSNFQSQVAQSRVSLSRVSLSRLSSLLICLTLAGELLYAARALPHAQPTAPQAVYDVRTAPAHLLTDQVRTAVDPAATFTVAMGIVVTCAYLVGLVERRDQVVLRMGIDSVAVLVLYLSTIGVLYWIS